MYSYGDLDSIPLEYSGVQVTFSKSTAVPRAKISESGSGQALGLARLPEAGCKPKSTCTQPSEKKRPRGSVADYTQEERSHGGKNCASNKREEAHNAIDRSIKVFANISAIEQRRFVLVDFVAFALPWLKNRKAAARRYGDYIKAKLASLKNNPAVEKLVEYVDRIRKALAAKAGKVFSPMFARIKGDLIRLSSNILKTSYRHVGAGWVTSMGIWAYFQDRETGECYTA